MDQVQSDTCQDTQKVPLYQELWRCGPIGRSYRDRGRMAPYEISLKPTCSQVTTCQGNSRTFDSPPTILVLLQEWTQMLSKLMTNDYY